MPRRVKVCQEAVRPVVESLEGRVLLTTVTGGGVDPVTGQPIVTQLAYVDFDGHIAVISVGGNTTAEFIFARVVPMSGVIAAFADEVPPPPPGMTVIGRDLFSIYVSQADSRSFISVTQIDPTSGDPIPFAASGRSFAVQNATTGRLVNVAARGSGALILGAQQDNPGPTHDRAIVSRTLSGAYGVRPALGRLTAGLQVAPGLDFGKFFFGGVVTGQVIVPGSMGSFYAGNVWTGDARGVFLGDQVISRGKRVSNFTIGGDLHSLLVSGSIGTTSISDNTGRLDRPNFASGFEMAVGGVLGEVNARDSHMGGVNVIHSRAVSPFGNTIEEVEGRNLLSGTPGTADGWFNGLLEGGNAVFNDTFATPQILPSYAGKKHRSAVVVNGQLQADPVSVDYQDYYGVAMLAGQDLTVTLRPLGTVAGASLMNVGVFDPDGRLIITDYPNVDASAVTGQPIHFTADRPGLYRIAVAPNGNGTFTGAALNIGNSPYVLTINGGGDLGLGGIAGNQILDGQLTGYGFFVQNGDMGALQAGGEIFSLTDQSINVRKGNLRSIEGGSVGLLTGNLFSASPNLYVTRGNVGLVRSTAGVVYLNENVLPLAIGGDYQVVSAATTLGATLIANRGIGVIRAGDMVTTNFTSIFTVNADLTGDDGIIDLIDVAGDLGTLNVGGPAITTGPGGNVRYFNVGGTVYRDTFFGGSQPEATTYGTGESVPLRDDSGTLINLTPFPVAPNPAFVPGGTNPANIGPSLTVTAYGIRGSGGVAIINVTSTGSVEVGAGAGIGSKAHAEIGLIHTTGTGNPVIRSTNDGSLVFSFPTGNFDTNAANLDVLIDGSATIDVFKILGSDFTSIKNTTPGEILNIDATETPTLAIPGFTNNGTIGSLSATNIGIGVHHTGAAVIPIQTISNAYPFNQQHNGVVSGNVLNVEASGAVGNLNISGNIGNVTANSGGRHSTGTFEGIAGPIVATANIATVDIGDGILPSGSGNVSRAGIYANGIIGSVRNRGLGSDIRGDIVSQSNIGRVTLTDGAIIGANIEVVSAFNMSRRIPTPLVLPDNGDTTTSPVFEIGAITLGGVGGIIGSNIQAADVGDIVVRRGFGIINSLIGDLGDGTINSVVAEGYGLRGVTLDGGSLLNFVSASAKPKNVSTLEYSASVRESERFAIDPFFDQAPSRETDLHIYLGTSARRPQVKRVTDTGVIADSLFTANRNAGTIFASQIRTSQFNIANQIALVETRSVVDGLSVTTGRLKNFSAGASVFALDFSVAGTIDSFHVNGDVDDTSNIRALGPSARIIDFIVDGSMNGDASSANNFHRLLIGKDLGATALIKAKTLDIQRIRGNIFGTIQIG
jgi:hypothetical protein